MYNIYRLYVYTYIHNMLNELYHLGVIMLPLISADYLTSPHLLFRGVKETSKLT